MPANTAARGKKPQGPTKIRCKNCGTIFTQNVQWKQFCQESCRKQFWQHGGLSFMRVKEAIIDALETPELIAKLRKLLSEDSNKAA